MTRKSVFSLFVLWCVLFLAAAPAGSEEFLAHVLFEEYPPYEYVDGKDVTGIHVEIVKAVFDRMGARAEFESLPWKRALLDLKQNKAFALISGHKTPDRERFAFYPDEPLSIENVVLMAPIQSDVVIRSLDDLYKLRIGLVSGYHYCEKFHSLHGLDTVEMRHTGQLVMLLLSGRVDVVITDKTVFRYYAKQVEQAESFKEVYAFSHEPLYIMFSKLHGEWSKQFAQTFSAFVREMREDGTIDAIRSQY